MKKIYKKGVCFLMVFVMLFCLSGIKVKAEEELEIQDKDGKYYIGDMIVYCMNNLLAWPDNGMEMSEETLENNPELEQAVKRLLYAGYPNNGLGFYEITDDPETAAGTSFTMEQYEALLTVPEGLKSILPAPYGNYATLAEGNNWQGFSLTVYSISDTEVKNIIMSTDFYNAAFCLENCDGDMLAAYEWYKGYYIQENGKYVTEDRAYYATQEAVWCLMTSFGVSHNNLSVPSSGDMARKLLDYALNGEDIPDTLETPVSGSLAFHKTDDGKYSTGELKLTGVGSYKLTLPDGMSVPEGTADQQDDRIVEITGNTVFHIVSDTEPAESTEIEIQNSSYPGAVRQFAPPEGAKDDVSGKGYQNMVGLVVTEASATINVTYQKEAEIPENPQNPSDLQEPDKGNRQDKGKPQISVTAQKVSETGDETFVGIWILLLVAAGVVCAGCLFVKKRRK